MIVVLFFRCMADMLNPVHRRGKDIKWGLISYTAVMFALVTAFTGMQLNLQFISYIDNREFPGIEGRVPPGPLGYQSLIYTGAPGIVLNVMFNLGNWLADGLLVGSLFGAALTRWPCLTPAPTALSLLRNLCQEPLGHRIPLPHVPWLFGYAFEFSANRRKNGANVVNVATGTLFVYQSSGANWDIVPINFGLPYFSISIALNVLLTFMIVIRLILHTRNIRTAMGGTGTGGLCKAIVTMLIESSTLYAVSSLLVVGQSSAGAADIFLPILAETQVRTFPRPRSPGSSSDAAANRAGHRSATHHSTSRQQERVDEQYHRLRTYR